MERRASPAIEVESVQFQGSVMLGSTQSSPKTTRAIASFERLELRLCLERRLNS